MPFNKAEATKTIRVTGVAPPPITTLLAVLTPIIFGSILQVTSR